MLTHKMLSIFFVVFVASGCHATHQTSPQSSTKTSAKKSFKLPDVMVKYGNQVVSNGDQITRKNGSALIVKATLPQHFDAQILLDGINVVRFGPGQNTWKISDDLNNVKAPLGVSGGHRLTVNLYPSNRGVRAATVYRTFQTK